jgi:hypothetical protein
MPVVESRPNVGLFTDGDSFKMIFANPLTSLTKNSYHGAAYESVVMQ